MTTKVFYKFLLINAYTSENLKKTTNTWELTCVFTLLSGNVTWQIRLPFYNSK